MCEFHQVRTHWKPSKKRCRIQHRDCAKAIAESLDLSDKAWQLTTGPPYLWWHFQDIDYLSRFVVNPPNSKLWSKCFVSMRTLTMVLRWAKWQDWKRQKYDSDGKWQKYDGKNVACLRSMFQGWYSFNPEPLSQLSLSYSDHTRSSDCMMHVGSHATALACAHYPWKRFLSFEEPCKPHSCTEEVQWAKDLSIEAFPWRECPTGFIQIFNGTRVESGRGHMRSGRGSEASQVGSHTAAKSPKNTGRGANQSPNKMNLASLGFHLWFHCFYVPASVFPKMALHIRHRIEPPK